MSCTYHTIASIQSRYRILSNVLAAVCHRTGKHIYPMNRRFPLWLRMEFNPGMTNSVHKDHEDAICLIDGTRRCSPHYCAACVTPPAVHLYSANSTSCTKPSRTMKFGAQIWKPVQKLEYDEKEAFQERREGEGGREKCKKMAWVKEAEKDARKRQEDGLGERGGEGRRPWRSARRRLGKEAEKDCGKARRRPG